VIVEHLGGGNLSQRRAGGVRFVPLISRHAFREES
jgi:hypothetical protein